MIRFPIVFLILVDDSWLMYTFSISDCFFLVSLNGLRGDLVNCSQLLLCCVDFVYMNIMNSENRHLISPSFVGPLDSSPFEIILFCPCDKQGFCKRVLDFFPGITLLQDFIHTFFYF